MLGILSALGGTAALLEEEGDTMRVSISTVVVAMLAIGGSVALHQEELTAAQQEVTNTALDKEALTALDRMGAYLRTLQAFQVEAVTTTEHVLEDGQKVLFSGVTTLVARMPDRLLIEETSDRRERSYIYDGKQFTVYARRARSYATVPAPATIALLADVLDEKFGLTLPLEDLFRWGGPKAQTKALTSAMYVGPSQVGGITCGHYVFRQEGLDWQVWIQLGDFPLPRKFVLTTLTDEARPQYVATYTWNLAPSFNDGAFAFVAPSGVGRVKMVETSTTGEK